MAEQLGLIRQAAVAPLRNGQVCLVSSRSGKRWVVPKGTIEPGRSAGEVALKEAWEEAGLVGLLHQEPLGSYIYEKDGSVCHVIVFRIGQDGLLELSQALSGDVDQVVERGNRKFLARKIRDDTEGRNWPVQY